MKKTCALLLSIALLLGTAAAFAAKYDPAVVALDGSLPIVKDPSQFEPFKIVNNVSWNMFRDMSELTMSIKITEETGIPIEWIGIPDAGYEEKVNLMLASRDLPDMFYKGIREETITQYSGQDVFLPTEDLIEKYVPRLVEIFKMRPEYAALTLYGDGHRYGFPYIEEMYGLTLTPGPFIINKNWLDQVGLDVPQTLNEFKEALLAFRDAGDLNGNGEADEIPYANNFVVTRDIFDTGNSFFTLMACFGEGVSYGSYYGYCKLDANKEKVVFPILNDAFFDALHFYNELNAEGLLDMDGFAGDGSFTYKMRQDDAILGAFSTWAPTNDIPVKSVYEQYVPLPRLDGPKGKMGIACNRSEVWGISQCVITTACKYPEILAAMINYMNEPEMAITVNWGAIDEVYYRREDGVLGFHLDENGYFVLPEGEGFETFDDVRRNSTPQQGGVVVLNDYYDTVAEYTYDARDLLAWQRANGKIDVLAEDTPLPPFMMTPDEQMTYSQIYPQIENIIRAYMVSSIMDGGIDENRESFEKQLYDAGLEEMLALVQSAYDRFLVTYNEYANK